MRENTSVLVCLVIVAAMLVAATTIAISVFNYHHAYAKGTVSGFDNTIEQEASNFRANNLICTHPDATCVSESG
jgi:hypothetical protein